MVREPATGAVDHAPLDRVVRDDDARRCAPGTCRDGDSGGVTRPNFIVDNPAAVAPVLDDDALVPGRADCTALDEVVGDLRERDVVAGSAVAVGSGRARHVAINDLDVRGVEHANGAGVLGVGVGVDAPDIDGVARAVLVRHGHEAVHGGRVAFHGHPVDVEAVSVPVSPNQHPGVRILEVAVTDGEVLRAGVGIETLSAEIPEQALLEQDIDLRGVYSVGAYAVRVAAEDEAATLKPGEVPLFSKNRLPDPMFEPMRMVAPPGEAASGVTISFGVSSLSMKYVLSGSWAVRPVVVAASLASWNAVASSVTPSFATLTPPSCTPAPIRFVRRLYCAV